MAIHLISGSVQNLESRICGEEKYWTRPLLNTHLPQRIYEVQENYLEKNVRDVLGLHDSGLEHRETGLHEEHKCTCTTSYLSARISAFRSDIEFFCNLHPGILIFASPTP
jgi:hypothetical protein